MLNTEHATPAPITREQLLAAIAQVTPAERTAEARRRMEKALAHIEAAQGQLNDACAELSTLVGAIPVWKAAGTLADRVKAFWYRVNAVQKYRLDDTHVESLARKKAVVHNQRAQWNQQTMEPFKGKLVNLSLRFSDGHTREFKGTQILTIGPEGGTLYDSWPISFKHSEVVSCVPI